MRNGIGDRVVLAMASGLLSRYLQVHTRLPDPFQWFGCGTPVWCAVVNMVESNLKVKKARDAPPNADKMSVSHDF
jgi:hypothetical protein